MHKKQICVNCIIFPHLNVLYAQSVHDTYVYPRNGRLSQKYIAFICMIWIISAN